MRKSDVIQRPMQSVYTLTSVTREMDEKIAKEIEGILHHEWTTWMVVACILIVFKTTTKDVALGNMWDETCRYYCVNCSICYTFLKFLVIHKN